MYATRAVRLSHSGVFKKKELWKNAVTYTARVGGTCGMFLRNTEEGFGTITLFFDEAVSEETRFHFEEYVKTHLERHALLESIQRRRIFVCPTCAASFTEEQVMLLRKLGVDWIRCSVCDTKMSLLER